jgi:hypothetical protein
VYLYDIPANEVLEGGRADHGMPTSPGREPVVVSPLQDAFVSLIEDAAAQPEEARRYLRYILASRNAEPAESEQERLALLRVVNSLSLAPQIVAPTALAELGAYRVDLRDYLWDHPIDIDGVTVSDGWEAIVERSGLALPPLPGEPLASLTGTATAVLPARAFLAAASSGSVYYALTRAPGSEVELQERLGARFPDLFAEQVYNAGLRAQRWHPYGGARRLILPDGRGYWQGLPNAARGNSLWSSPFDFNSWETDAIYPLPNGLPAFFLDGPHNEGAPLTQRGQDALMADCIACHSAGPAALTDALLEFLRANPDGYGSEEEAAEIIELWPTQEELDYIVSRDNAAYRRVLDGAGLNAESAGTLQTVTRGYADAMDIADMAAALHASETQVRAVLSAGTTTLDAKTFKSQFRALLCQIHPDAGAISDYCG